MTESLICAGAFDDLGLNRRQMLENLDPIISVNSSVIDGQLDLFGGSGAENEVYVPDAPEYPYSELLAMEKEVTGIFMSGHPLEEYDYLVRLSRIPYISDITEDTSGKYSEQSEVSGFGTVISEKSHTTRKGDRMSFVTVEDMSGKIECVVFPDVFKNFGGKLKKDSTVRLSGKISEKEEGKSIIVTAVFTADEFENAALRRKLCISTSSSGLKDAMAMLPPSEKGNVKVCFYLSDLRKIIAPHGEISVKLTHGYYTELLKSFPDDKMALI